MPIPGNPALTPGIAPAGASGGAPAIAPGAAGGAAGAPAGTPGAPKRTSASGPAFAEVLRRAAGAEPLSFSRHAAERVARRGIELDPTTLARLHEGVGRAAGKGSRDSVVLVDGTAFVVSVGSRTVVTAVNAQHMREHVFTNIDSAVIA
jgi:flagellar operon protein